MISPLITQALGDRAAVVRFPGDFFKSAEVGERVRAFVDSLTEDPLPGQLAPIAAYATVTVVFARPIAARELESLEKRARRILPRRSSMRALAPIEIPVHYDGPDLADVAKHQGISEAEVVLLHTEPIYHVHQIGFAPGFPYLGGLSPKLETPRLASPRPRVPAGSVGIGGAQTGVYPFAGPGGWRIIGHTKTVLFDPARKAPSLLKTGMQVRFVAC